MNLKIKIDSHITKIIKTLQDNGYETYLVGGAIRDLLLGRTPKDYDISTSASPNQILSVFKRQHCRKIGKRFQLVHLYLGSEIIEITTFRTTPQVDDNGKVLPFDNEFGTSQDDAWRRDFTVNAIFYDPVNNEFKDFTKSGMKDLKKGIVRIVGDPMERFEEDPVRILRALKLVGQYGFKLEKKTAKALKESLPLITHCPISRLALELEKIITRAYSVEIFQAFYNYGFLAYYLPFLNQQWETEEGRYMQELLKERNKRLASGKYRDSISLAIATTALPFIEKEFIGEIATGEGWEYFYGIEKVIKRILSNTFAPYNFPKRVIASSISTILMQPSLLRKQRKERVLLNKKYRHGRELLTLQLNTKIDDDTLLEFWPKHGKRGTYKKSKRGRFNNDQRKSRNR